jgi:hypothetical protein
MAGLLIVNCISAEFMSTLFFLGSFILLVRPIAKD